MPVEEGRMALRSGGGEGSHLTNLAMSLNPQTRKRFSFWVGVSLMVLSFGIYLAYPAVPFLPISRGAKGGVAVGMSLASWAIFLVGSVLAGKEGLASLKQRFSGRGAPRADRGGA